MTTWAASFWHTSTKVETQLIQKLKTIFGHDSFRDGQENLIRALMSGHDTLGIMPTGAGKSICYQLPALLLPGITLVISPLIALMKDQVMSLKASGVAAAYINSSLTPGQQQEAIRRARNGAYKIIYVAPERLETPQFLDFAREADISLVAVDEAHCVSQWGQDFRPSYLHIPGFLHALPKRPPVGAFTATATLQVRQDIIRMLELNQPFCTTTGYNRPNLRFVSVKPTNKLSMLCRFLDDMGQSCGIVYCSTRKNVEQVCDWLNDAGYSATRYHAGLSDAERRKNQDNFKLDRVRIMVATNAFGMGIDKADVRFVVHYNMPKNLESYYQEAGRAGRDGDPAECLLLYSGQDVITAKWMIEHSEDNPELSSKEREEIQKRDLERLKQMTYYATGKTCLRQFLLRYFGEVDAPAQCDNCSVCEGLEFEVDTGSGRRTSPSVKRAADKLQRQRPKEPELTGWEAAMMDNLRRLRTLVAGRKGVPLFLVFSDASLRDMVKKRPRTREDFLSVSGVGEAKLAQFGDLFLAVLRDGLEPNEAMEQYADDPIPAPAPARKAKKTAPWTPAEEANLRREFENDTTYAAMATNHQRSQTAILRKLMEMGLIERGE